MSDEVPLREFLEARDNQLEGRFEKFEKDNAEDHAAVIRRLEAIEGKLGGVVTWRSLGFALTLALALYALADRL